MMRKGVWPQMAIDLEEGYMLRPGMWEPLLAFATAHVASKDIDPVYPVLRHIQQTILHLNTEQSLWSTFLYVSTYHLPAALVLWQRSGQIGHVPTLQDLEDLPTGTERRGFRGAGGKVKQQEHIADYAMRMMDGRRIKDWPHQTRWWGTRLTAEPGRNFDIIFTQAQTIKHNGRWAAYKWCDLLHEVHDWPVTANSLKLDQCTGPREGLAWLYMVPDNTHTAILEAMASQLRDNLRAAGLDLTYEQLETIICDFNSLRKGHYYVGHDIDQMLQQAHAIRSLGAEGERAWLTIMQARIATLPTAYLGEVYGWDRVDTRRKTVFAEQHQVLLRNG